MLLLKQIVILRRLFSYSVESINEVKISLTCYHTTKVLFVWAMGQQVS